MRKTSFATMAVFMACVSLGWAAGSTAPAALDTVHLAIGYIPHVQFTPLYVGIDKGFYKAEGIDLQLSFGFQYDVFSLLAAGKIDIGLSDSDQLILAGSKNMGLQAIFQYYQKYPVTIVAKSDTVATPADLKGKVIGTPEVSGTSYIGLELFLKKYGLVDDARIEKIGYTQESTLLSGKAAAVVCFYNNEPVQLKSEGISFRQWDVKAFSDMVGASFISSKAIIANRTDVIARFVRATQKAMAYTVDHRDEAAGIALKNVGNVKKEDEPAFRLRLDATCDLFVSAKGYGYLDADKYTRSIQELVGLGLIPATFPAANILRQF